MASAPEAAPFIASRGRRAARRRPLIGMERVGIRALRTYEQSAVDEAVEAAIADAGGLPLLLPGMRVLLKPNLVMRMPPERAATTHPSVVAAVARLVVRAGATPVIGDSPGGPFTRLMLGGVYQETGMAEAARQSGAELNDDFESVTLPGGLHLCRMAASADVVINLPKLKMHGLMVLSCAVKNLFGCVPGVRKLDYHARYPDPSDFAEALVRVAAARPPELTVVDGVVGMEGQGPSHGTPRPAGAILAGRNVHAVDACAAKLVGLAEADVPTLAAARAGGLIPQIELIGDRDLAGPAFALPPRRAASSMPGARTAAGRAVLRAYTPVPDFSPARCTGCGTCVKLCPVQALAAGKPPAIRRAACIRCRCCAELCPRGAVTMARPFLLRLTPRWNPGRG